jgi:hypothetical protein
VPLQSTYDELHDSEHTPAVHFAVELGAVGHAEHEPQCVASAPLTKTSQPLLGSVSQSANPLAHVNEHLAPLHDAVPFPPAGWGHGTPHVPQLPSEVWRSTHAVPQSVRGHVVAQVPFTQNGVAPEHA